jgi:deazaflavin-dependent oxidoreductase (nitroreductase family)
MTEYTAPDLTLYGDAHVRRYEETNGESGYTWNGVPTLLLTTTGRKSGHPRTVALIFGRDDEHYIVIASKGGMPEHPLWYRNLSERPSVQVQVRGDRFTARARTAEDDERERCWATMAAQWPNYNVYAQRTTRVIPVVVLERV